MECNQSPWTTKSEFIALCHLKEGTGYFGKVWKAQHAILGIKYAIKQVFINRTLKFFDGDVNKLFREVKLLQEINHPNVVRYFYFWLEGPNVSELPDRYVLPPPDESWTSGRPLPPEQNFVFIQMELCDQTLKQWLANHPTIENRKAEISNILIQVTTGLKAIHEQKIIHRDLKADNIFKLGSIWKIGDFGLSTKFSEKSINHTENDYEIAANSARGCSAYRSPEVQNTMKSDVYTLALIFLEILIPKFKPYDFDFLKDWIYGQNPTDGIKKLIPLNYLEEYGIICQMLNPNEVLRPDSQTVLKLLTQINNREGKPITLSSSQNENNIVDQDPLSFEVRKPVSNFTGRAFELSELHKAYKQRRFILVISGLGGVGKTELVRNFALSFYKNYQGNCLWMESEDEQRLVESVKRLALELKIRNINTNASTLFLNVFKKLNALPTLLIFDNVDSVNSEVENLIRSFRNLPPGTEPPLIVITTRNKEVISLTGGESIELNVLDDKEAIQLITNSISQVNPEDAKTLCKTLQNFPLTMQQAICYINYRRKIGKKLFNIPDFLKLFEQQKKKILDYKLTLADHDYSLTTLTTWNMSFDSIKSDEELGPVAAEVLDFWAYEILNPDGESLPFVIELYENFESVKSHDSQADADLIETTDKFIFLKDINHNPFTSSKFWKPRDSKYLGRKRPLNSFHFGEYGVAETDLMDDDRTVARAIQLIQTYSICNLEIRYVNNADKQFLTIHRLVQEVIRISKVKNLEFEFLQNFIRYLLHSTFRSWSNSAQHTYKKREHMIKSIWPFVSKHTVLISEFANVFNHIWKDCVDGYVPFELKLEGVEFLNEVLQSLFKYSDESNFSTMILEYFYLKSDLGFKLTKPFPNRSSDQRQPLFIQSAPDNKNDEPRTGFKPIKLLELFLKQKRLLPPNHLLSIETLDFLTTWINEIGLRGLGGTDDSLAASNAAKVCLDILQIFISTKRTMSSIQLLRVLITIGQTIDGFRALNNFESIFTFAKDILEIVQICINPTYIYLLQCIGYCMSIVGMEQKANEFLSEMGTKLGSKHEDLIIVDKLIVQQLVSQNNQRTFERVPASIAMKLIQDTFTCFDFESRYNAWHLNIFFNTLIAKGYYEFVIGSINEGLNVCANVCSKQKHEQAFPLFYAIKKTELELWEAGRYKECIEIGQNLPKFCKYRKQFMGFSTLIIDWIDQIMSRFQSIKSQLQNDFFEVVPVNAIVKSSGSLNEHSIVSHNKNSNSEVSTNLDKQVSENCTKSDISVVEIKVYSSTHSLFARCNCYWEIDEFENWQQEIETSLIKMQEFEGFVDYMESKICQDICEKLTAPGRDLSTVPPKILRWAFLFALQNHHYIYQTKSHHVIQVIVDNLQEQKDNQGLVHFGQTVCDLWAQANLDKPIIPIDTSAVIRENVANFWYFFLAIQTIGTALRYLGACDEDLKLIRTFLNLATDSTIDEIYQIQRNVMEYYLKGSYETSVYFVIIPTIIVQLIDQFFHYTLNICGNHPKTNTYSDDQISVILKHFIQHVITQFRKHDDFGEIFITFSNALSNVKEKSEIHLKLADRFALNNVIKEWVKTGDDISDALCLIETVLATDSKYQESKVSIESELNALVSLVIEDFQSIFKDDNFLVHPCVLQTIFVALKCGSVVDGEVETLVVKTLEQYLGSFNYEKIYNFGIKIASIPKLELKREKLCLKLVSLVVDYLHKACEIDVDKIRRIFKVKEKCKISEDDHRNHFLILVDDLFSKFQVEFKECEVSSTLLHEYKQREILNTSYQSVQSGGQGSVQPLDLD